MAILTELPFESARKLLAGYDLILIDLKPLSAGSVNSNFFLETETEAGVRKSLFARIYEEQGEEGARFELELNLRLFEAQIPVARPLRREDGELLCDFGGKPFAVYERIGGEVSCQALVNEARCYSVGQALAQVHTADLRGLELKPSRFGGQQILERLETVEEAGRASLNEAVARIRRDCLSLALERDPELPCGLIHGDLFRDNVLLNGDEVSGLLDFESASLGSYAYDLMVTLLAWCYGAELEEDLVLALLRGYSSVRTLTRAERRGIVAEGCFACVRFAATRLTDFSLRVPEGEPPGRDYRRFFERQDALRSGKMERCLQRIS